MGTWSFGYDYLNRLNSAISGSDAPAQYSGNYGCWSYDAFGNRRSESISPTPCADGPAPTSWAHYNTHNQFLDTSQAPGGIRYDGAGNINYDGVNQYLYDGDGRICAVMSQPLPSMTTMTGYIYDADGARVSKGTISSWSCDPVINGFQTTSDYVLGLSGEQVTEMSVGANGAMTWQHTNVYAAGGLLATYDQGGLHFYLNDPLGTRRAQTDYAGVPEQTCSSLPFGNGLACTGSNQYPTEHHLTGKERDTESGNDYFGARYYASAMGRFMSPDYNEDPQPIPFAQISNPQTLNLYAYVLNNPLSVVDADGHTGCVGGSDLGDGRAMIAARPCYNDPTDDTRLRSPGHMDDGRVIPGDLGLSWYVGGKLGEMLGEGALGILDRLFGRVGGDTLAQVWAKLTPSEKAMVEELIKEGHDVAPIARGAGQTADFLVDGVETELKTVTANGPNSVKNAIEKAATQTNNGNILIDARPSGIGTAEANAQVKRAAGNLGQSAVKGRVTVLTKSGTVKF